MSISTYLKNKINDHMVGKAAYTMPQAFVALCTSSVTVGMDGSTIPEFADANNYARVTTTASHWASSSNGTSVNAIAITANKASGTWGTAAWFAVLDSVTHGAGNVLFAGTIGTPKDITTNDTPSFAAGELSLITA